MPHITDEQLEHLAKLARITLTTEDKAKLGPQIDTILEFVGQLKDCPLDDGEEVLPCFVDESLTCRSGVVDFADTDGLLANTKHPIRQHAIEVTGRLKEGDTKSG